jgi:hypothetical protein
MQPSVKISPKIHPLLLKQVGKGSETIRKINFRRDTEEAFSFW